LKFIKNIKLPEYGYIGFTELEESIIDTFYFQRLRRIRQSPGVSLVYPGASHTRFEHSLGAMHLAGEAATHLILNSKNNLLPIIEYFKTADERAEMSRLVQTARLGGLLHDVGHGPLSHTFEYFLKLCYITFAHENLSIQIIYEKLKKYFEDKTKNPYKVDVRHIISLLCDITRKPDSKISIKKETQTFLGSIGLSNADISFMEDFLSTNWFLNHIIKEDPYNVDRFNYLILDSNRSGAVEYGAIDVERLIQNLYIHKDVVTVSSRARDAALRFFEAYSHMYKSIYLHKVSYGADLHLAYAMFLASEEEPSSMFGNLRNNHDLEDILPLSDDVLLYELNKIKSKKCRPVIDDFLQRKIMSRVYETDSKEFRKLLIEKGKAGVISEIRKKAKLSEDVIITIASIEEKKASPPPFTEEALVRVSCLNLDTNEREKISEEVIGVLTPKETYRVYTLKDDKILEKVKTAARSLIG
jgi:HD superfamily phosphohydrolase